MSRDWLLFVGDMIEAAEKIERLTTRRTFESFMADEGILDAVLMNLLVQVDAGFRSSTQSTMVSARCGGLRG